MTDEELLIHAAEARRAAYAPYSHFAVGAAVLAASGKVYTGANVENASYGLTVCAERVAIWRAVSEGEREIQMVAVATEDGATPCGACRQVMAEFAPGDHDLGKVRVVVGDQQGRWRTYTLADLLPEAFTAEKLPAPPGLPALPSAGRAASLPWPAGRRAPAPGPEGSR